MIFSFIPVGFWNLFKMLQYKLKRIYVSGLLLLSTYTIFWYLSVFDNFKRESSKHIKERNDFSCYFLPQVFEDTVGSHDLSSSTPRDVYMHFTFCKRPLNPAHFCAIEAASRAYRNLTKTNILFNKPLIFHSCKKRLITELLVNYSNMDFIRLQIENYMLDTPYFGTAFKQFRNSTFIKRLPNYKIVEDMLKLATLYKYGGTVVDSDVIMTTTNYFDQWLIMENDLVSMDALKFSTDPEDIVGMSIM